MAKVIGPFGLLSGKLGNRIYYIVNGEQRSRAVGKVTKPPTEKQLANRQRMKVAFAFAKSVGLFLEMGFAGMAGRKRRPRNVAVGYMRKHSLSGEYPDIGIDYARVVLSRGDLPGLIEASVEVVDGLNGLGLSLRYSWAVAPADRDWPRRNDQVMLMAYCPEVVEADTQACFKLTGARRIAGEDVLPLPEAFAGKLVEVYISVIADDRKSVSDSSYLGMVVAEVAVIE